MRIFPLPPLPVVKDLVPDLTNFIMNVAAIAISMPVALVMAPYLGVAPEVIFFAALVTVV